MLKAIRLRSTAAGPGGLGTQGALKWHCTRRPDSLVLCDAEGLTAFGMDMSAAGAEDSGAVQKTQGLHFSLLPQAPVPAGPTVCIFQNPLLGF